MNRSPNGINKFRFLEGYGVRILHYRESRSPRPPNVVYGGRQIARLIRKDADRAGLTVRCIQASNPTCFDDATVYSVWCFLGAHFPQGEASSAIGAFSAIDVGSIRRRAQRLVMGRGGRMAKTANAMSILLANEILQNEIEDRAA